MIDGNKKIAEFLGYEIKNGILKGNDKCILYNEINNLYVDELEFHKDWNLLICIVNYIENINLSDRCSSFEDINGNIESNFCGIRINIENNKCWIYIEYVLDSIYTISNIQSTKIEATYDAVLECIEYLKNI